MSFGCKGEAVVPPVSILFEITSILGGGRSSQPFTTVTHPPPIVLGRKDQQTTLAWLIPMDKDVSSTHCVRMHLVCFVCCEILLPCYLSSFSKMLMVRLSKICPDNLIKLPSLCVWLQEPILLSLPVEVTMLIFSHLSAKVLCTVSQVLLPPTALKKIYILRFDSDEVHFFITSRLWMLCKGLPVLHALCSRWLPVEGPLFEGHCTGKRLNMVGKVQEPWHHVDGVLSSTNGTIWQTTSCFFFCKRVHRLVDDLGIPFLNSRCHSWSYSLGTSQHLMYHGKS